MTLIDFPGKIACTVFLAGCNYRCPFCYNPPLVLPEVMKNHLTIPEKDFFQFLKERKEHLEGVCISGGEPTIQEKLIPFCRKIKKMGYYVKLDTNGSNPEALEDIISAGLIDYAAMDIKAPQEKYPELIGFKNCSANYILNKVSQSISILKKNRIDYEFRTTVAPKFLNKKDILKIGQWLSPGRRYVIQNFKPGRNIDLEMEKMKPWPEEDLFSLQKSLSPFFDAVEIR